MTNIKHIYSCNIGDTLELISGRWKPEILWHLKNGTTQFSRLLKNIDGISQKVLTQQIRELERDGLVVRKDNEEKIRRVEYSSTALAKSLAPVFSALKNWTVENGEHVVAARQKFDSLSEG